MPFITNSDGPQDGDETREYSQPLSPGDSLNAAAMARRAEDSDIATPEIEAGAARRGTPTALQAAAVISASLLLAKIIGLVQIIVISNLMPLEANDAYRAAFKIIDFVNYLVAGGAMSLTFIPIFTDLRLQDNASTRGDNETAWRFFSTIATVMTLFLLALIAVTYLAAPWISDHYLSGFDAEKRALTASMLRIMLPAQWAFYVGGMIVGVLNANKRFGASAMTGAIYNLVAILAAIALWMATASNPLSFAWGILIGALVGNFLLPLLASTRGPREDRLRFRPSLDVNSPGVKKFFRNVLPIMLGVSFPVVDQIVSSGFASHLPEGALTQLDNANRVLMAPLSILAQAAAVAAFPFLASDSAAAKWRDLSDFMRSGLRRLLFIALPVSFLLVLISKPLIVLLFRHGAYSQASARATAVAFAFYSIGLFAWAGQQFVARGFYALKDTITPTIIGTVITFLFYIPLLFASLHFGLGVAGMALATTLGAALHFSSMLIALEKKLREKRYDAPLHAERVLGTMLRTLCACAAMSFFGVLANIFGARVLAGSNPALLASRILLTSAVAAVAFHFAATAFQIPEWNWLRGKFAGRLARR